MNTKHKFGFSLIELLVVIAIMSILIGITIRSVRMVSSKMASVDTVRTMVGTALTTSRTLAMAQQTHIGIHFSVSVDGTHLLSFIRDDNTYVEDTNIRRYRVIVGNRNMVKETSIPSNIGLLDMQVGGNKIDKDTDTNDPFKLLDTNTFSMVFSPAGKLVLRFMWIVDADNNLELLGPEVSRNCLYIYDKTTFEKVDVNNRYTGYLQYLPPVLINYYTGKVINK